MDNPLINQIITRLNNQNYYNETQASLWHGKTGCALINFLLFNYTGEIKFSEQAGQLLNDVSENILSVRNMGFEYGLAGIGWAIEWAAQNNFLDINTDEILEDMDSAIYKSLMFSPDKDFFLANGTISKLIYFSKRYQSRNNGSHRFKKIYEQECLVLLTDELYDKLISHDKKLKIDLQNSDNSTLFNLGYLVTLLSNFLQLKFNEPTVEKTLYILIDTIDAFLKFECNNLLVNTNQNNFKHHFLLLFLGISYLFAGNYHAHKYWQKKRIF